MPDRIHSTLLTALPGFALALAATGWCAWATGAGLGLFLGATILAALYVPALTVAEPPRMRWTPATAATIAVALCWAVSMNRVDVTSGELFRCTLVFATIALALGGVTSALARAGVAPSLAAGVVVTIAMLWLTWPVWLSHALTQSRVDRLVPAHPLMAINGVVAHLGAWDRAPIAYQKLTVLNQDIPYHLPRSILPATLLHGAIAAIGFALARPRHPVPAPLVRADAPV